MAVFVNIADLVDTDDPQQRTHRQINAEKRHSIPVGALVATRRRSIGSRRVRMT
jgi:hypothetical protein